MVRYKDMSNERYGKLTCVEYVGKDKHKNALWRCVCDCGGEKIVSRKLLINGDTRSCGCLHEKKIQGERFGKLVAIELLGTNEHRRNEWLCKCDCGNEIVASATDLTSGHTRSCGCLMKETTSKTFTTHGLSRTRLYVVWCGMLARCNNPNNARYKHYGGRGIKVCDEWLSFENFHEWAMANGYDENAKVQQCTIDRIDNDDNYEPSNCRWVDAKTQANNKRPYDRHKKRGPYKKHLKGNKND